MPDGAAALTGIDFIIPIYYATLEFFLYKGQVNYVVTKLTDCKAKPLIS